MSDCRFGVSPVNYPDPDPDQSFKIQDSLFVRSCVCMLWNFAAQSASMSFRDGQFA